MVDIVPAHDLLDERLEPVLEIAMVDGEPTLVD